MAAVLYLGVVFMTPIIPLWRNATVPFRYGILVRGV